MERRFKWGLTGAMGAAVAASACCTIPLLLVSVGIGGAWVSSLVALEPFRPYFIGLTVLLFGVALVQSNRNNDGPECDCEDEMSPTTKNVLLSIGALLALALILSPKFLNMDNMEGAVDATALDQSVEFKEVKLTVEGMTCETCPATVHKALSELEGVFEVLVTYEPPVALVRYDAKRVGVEQFELATRNAGYPALPETDEASQ